MPVAHVSIPVASLSTSTAFYLTTLKPLGYKVYLSGDAFVGFAVQAPDFWLHSCPDKGNIEAVKEKSGLKDEGTSGVHLAFNATSKSLVHKVYDAAVAAGATCNGPPGLRPQYTAGYYAAYFLDPDGHNIEVLYYNPWWLQVLTTLPWVGAMVVGAGGAWAVRMMSWGT